jgi:hypothetical protein
MDGMNLALVVKKAKDGGHGCRIDRNDAFYKLKKALSRIAQTRV